MVWSQDHGSTDRFDRKVDRSGDCWIWTGATAGAGYGTFRLSKPERRMVGAHRLSLERKLGRELRPDERARHTCDNPPCVNPDHLIPGTVQDNSNDKISRGRQARGEGHRSARLTDRQVQEIRALAQVPGVLHREIAERYGVGRSTITLILAGKRRASETVTIAANSAR